MNVIKVKYPIDPEIAGKLEVLAYDKRGNVSTGFLFNNAIYKTIVCESEDSFITDIIMYIPLEEVINHFEKHL